MCYTDCYANCLRDIDQQCEGGLAPASPLTDVSRGLPNKAVQSRALQISMGRRCLSGTAAECLSAADLHVIQKICSSCNGSPVRALLINTLQRSGHYIYHQFNIQQFYVLPTQCIYVFCVDLRTNSDYFPIQHELTGLYNRVGVCLLRGTD